jgi:UDP-N-acetyl-D-glucosamine dehydrogenase
MPEYIVNRIEDLLGGQLSGKKILICGVAYKKDVADVRESPSEALIDLLRIRESKVLWHDPLVGKWRGEVSSEIEKDLDLDLIVIAVAHSTLNLEAIDSQSTVIFDTTFSLQTAIQL